jgi:hypothetical protein
VDQASKSKIKPKEKKAAVKPEEKKEAVAA